MLPILHVPKGMILPDNKQWQNRFQVESESSDRLYVISQHKEKRHWACSCPGWKRHPRCKHLEAIGVPGKEQPFEVNLINE